MLVRVPDTVRRVTSDASVALVAVLVREFHDLTAGTPPAAGAEVVRHNDLSPGTGASVMPADP
jgi:hypothetical protein